jgi:hypothetical protein
MVELKEYNSLIMLENSIMCDRLEHLYSSLSNLIGSFSSTEKLTHEYEIIHKSAIHALQTAETLENSLKLAISENEKLKENVAELASVKTSLETIREKTAKSYKTTMSILKKELELEKTERGKIDSEKTELEKKLANSSSELKICMKKFSKIKQAGKNDKSLLKVCMKCGQIFTEDTNFNWSCRVHLSKFSGEQYWCCGKTDVGAEGCITGKHINKEDAEMERNDIHMVFCTVKNT